MVLIDRSSNIDLSYRPGSYKIVFQVIVLSVLGRSETRVDSRLRQ